MEERGFEEGDQMVVQNLGVGQVGAPYLPLLPHCICSRLSKREIRWRGMFLLPLTLGLKVGETPGFKVTGEKE